MLIFIIILYKGNKFTISIENWVNMGAHYAKSFNLILMN